MNSQQVFDNHAEKRFNLPEPDPDNITVLTRNLPNKPILPWHHYDSPWSEAQEDSLDPSNETEESEGGSKDLLTENAEKPTTNHRDASEPSSLVEASREVPADEAQSGLKEPPDPLPTPEREEEAEEIEPEDFTEAPLTPLMEEFVPPEQEEASHNGPPPEPLEPSLTALVDCLNQSDREDEPPEIQLPVTVEDELEPEEEDELKQLG